MKGSIVVEEEKSTSSQVPGDNGVGALHPTIHAAAQPSSSQLADVCENKETSQSTEPSIDSGAKHGSSTAASVHVKNATMSNTIAAGECNSEGASSESDEDASKAKPKDKKSKADKKPLRKGKWAVEEEEYTSRVIQHFSAGVLTLPEGATLRSYLADKLNCDPMRITKKFTGACCLGRRVYHLRDRPRATPAELEMAKAERDHLEQRFRLRIEHEQSGLPLSRRRDMLASQPSSQIGTLFPVQNVPPGNTMSPWLQNFASGIGAPSSNASMNISTTNPSALLATAHHLNQGSLPMSHPTRLGVLGSPEGLLAAAKSDPSLQLLNNLVTSWVVAQASIALPRASVVSTQPSNTASMPLPTAASVPSKYSTSQSTGLDLHLQLKNAYEEQRKEEEQRQLRAAFEDQKKKAEASHASKRDTNHPKIITNAADQTTILKKNHDSDESGLSPAEQLQKSYEAHLLTLDQQSGAAANIAAVPTQSSNSVAKKSVGAEQGNTRKSKEKDSDKAMDEQEAGTVLLGFLNSLRQSYEDAVEDKAAEAPLKAKKHKRTVTETRQDNPCTNKSTQEVDKTPDDTPDIDNNAQDRSSGAISSSSDEDKGRNISRAVSQFMSSARGRKRPASVTDASSGNSSSQPTEFSSSLEDSSDKTEPSEDSSEKTDQSSSEEEKEDKDDEVKHRPRSRGPPRKRIKGAFTQENLLVHSRRMSEKGNH